MLVIEQEPFPACAHVYVQELLAFGGIPLTLDDVMSVSGKGKPLTARRVTAEREERAPSTRENYGERQRTGETNQQLLYLGTSQGVPHHQNEVGKTEIMSTIFSLRG